MSTVSARQDGTATDSAGDSRPTSESLYEQAVKFVVRRRVALSIVLFGSLIIEDLVRGVVPRDVFDLADPRALFGLLGVLSGLALRSWAAGFLIKDSELTTVGPYAVIRNPLYLGSFLMAAGFCLLIDDPENIFIIPALLVLIYLPKVRSEERGLSARFPDKWAAYAARTPRFVPRSVQRIRLAGWRTSQWLRSREYNAVLASAAALVALKIVRQFYA